MAIDGKYFVYNHTRHKIIFKKIDFLTSCSFYKHNRHYICSVVIYQKYRVVHFVVSKVNVNNIHTNYGVFDAIYYPSE